MANSLDPDETAHYDSIFGVNEKPEFRMLPATVLLSTLRVNPCHAE